MPCTGRSRFPASPSPRSTLRGRSRSSWTKDVRGPARRGTAGGQGRDTGRVGGGRPPLIPPPRQAARRPESARARSRPGARCAPQRRGPRQAAFQWASKAPPRPGRNPQRLVLDHPVTARRRRGRQDPGRRAREGGTDRRGNAVARIDPRRAHADDARGRSGSRRSADPRGRACRTDVQGRGSRLAHAAATHEARPLPGRYRELPCGVRPAAGGESRRADARAKAPAGSQRAVHRRRQARTDPPLPCPVLPSTAGGWPTQSPQRRHRRSAGPLSA